MLVVWIWVLLVHLRLGLVLGEWGDGSGTRFCVSVMACIHGEMWWSIAKIELKSIVLNVFIGCLRV